MPALPPLQIVAVIDALVDAFDALTCPVFDGPPNTQERLPVAVIVGYDGVSEEGRVGGFAQQYAHLGLAAQRDESGDVICAVWAQSGDADYATLRARVSDVVGQIQTLLRADPTLGLDWVARVELAGGDMYAGDADGNAVRLTFRLTYESRT